MADSRDGGDNGWGFNVCIGVVVVGGVSCVVIDVDWFSVWVVGGLSIEGPFSTLFDGLNLCAASPTTERCTNTRSAA